MHETVFAASLLKIVLEEAEKHTQNGQKLRISNIVLHAGLLNCFEPSTLQGCFEIIAEGTAAQNAVLDIIVDPLKGYCPDCKQEVHTSRRFFSCPVCAAPRVDWMPGNELYIETIKVVPV